ncbi:SDR family NAD(P)-dependent oxidoreductase [Leisingera daeponensis]|uniref:SDR family NAD(P)-dependent oxidoreductase n=1 Tax=Leisingera daeponensis TaxID=405746 RepID=A0ABS7NM29_9RHOB|nr:SDR family NAD(P)-dependent oxidoreductase [Leisingera daeponensis]MBY6059509.1 SDR family NAD(P)-dependent oxidoreductase [Leisingera daeponensis]MBY6142245.1 SDR family NAD(P)-dependent oxidoreductase [Leisingera daeponensis]
MTKTILITDPTDGLGRATAEAMARQGHSLILPGRNRSKLEAAAQELCGTSATMATVQADLSVLDQAAVTARQVIADHPAIDVLINNVGMFKTGQTVSPGFFDVRFAVNTFAPALLTQRLLPVIAGNGRIIHLSSAAQTPVDLDALAGGSPLPAMEAYAQSKLAITLWSQHFASEHPEGPVSIAVNPGSLLATRMVREGFGTSGNDLSIGVDILAQAALSEEFADASGRYYDNDAGQLAPLYPAALAQTLSARVNQILQSLPMA